MIFRLDIRKCFFTQQVIEHWDSPPREVMMAPRLPELKKHLDNTFRQMMMRFLGYLCRARN